MCFHRDLCYRNACAPVIIHSLLPNDLLFACTSLCKIQLDPLAALDAYQISGIKREDKVFVLHFLPQIIRFHRHSRLVRQAFLLRIRHINGNEIVAVVLHIKYVDPHHAAVGRDAVSNRQSHRGFLADFHLVYPRPRRTILLGLIERLGKGLRAIAAEIFQPRQQRIV